MRNWAHLKIMCGNNKAQSLTELATFGTVLLLVLAFFIRYALQFNYQQDVKMRAFRMALVAAYTNYGAPEPPPEPPPTPGPTPVPGPEPTPTPGPVPQPTPPPTPGPQPTHEPIIDQDTPHSSATIKLVEDKHIPDPQDRFGVGGINTMQAEENIVWGNTLDPALESYKLEDLPKIRYVMNGGVREYTTAFWRNIIGPDGQAPYAGGAFKDLPDNNGVYNGHYDPGEPYIDPTADDPGGGGAWICPAGVYAEFSNSDTLILIPWGDMRIYRPSSIDTPPTADDTPQVWVLDEVTHTTELVTAVAIAPTDVPAEIVSIFVPDKLIEETNPASHFFIMQGDPIRGLMTLDPAAAQINLNYTVLNEDLNYDNRPDVTAQNLQGLRPDDDVQTVRDDTLNLEERSVDGGYYKSTGQVNTTATVTHKIGLNGITIPVDYPVNISGGNTTWQTPK